jgi:hypothetical protein
MKLLRSPLLLAAALIVTALAAPAKLATATAPVLNIPDGVPFAPDFTKPLGAEWKVVKGAWTAENGELRGDEVPADKHSAVLWHPGKVESLIIQCEFRLGGAGTFYVGFDGQRHVGRLVVRANSIGLYDDSPEPNLKPAEKPKSHPLSTFETKLKPDEWHPLTLEIRGDEMAALVAGVQLKAQHPYLATPKERFWFAVGGKDLRIRNLKVWNAKANPEWPSLRGQFGK